MSDNYPSDVKLDENPDGSVSFATGVVETIAGLAAQGRGLLAHGQRVQVGHHVKALVFLLQRAPVAHRPHVVAQGKGAGGLDAG